MNKVIFLVLLATLTFATTANEGVPMKQQPGGHWSVDVKINDRITYPFLIDTGAQGAIIPSTLVERLSLDPDKFRLIDIQAATGIETVELVELESIAVGGAYVEGIKGVIMDLPLMEESGISPGLLPYTFLENFIVEFDFPNKKLILHNKSNATRATLNKGNISKFPMQLIDGSFISIIIETNDKPLQAILDSGAGDSMIINLKAANLLNINTQSLSDGKPITGATGGSLNSKSYSGVKLNINDMKFPDQSVSIADMPTLEMFYGDEPAANMGIGIFKNQRLIIDYGEETIYVVSEEKLAGLVVSSSP